MTVLSLSVVSPLAARADEHGVSPAAARPGAAASAAAAEPPASLIERALHHAGLCGEPGSDGALAASQWVPELRLGAVVSNAIVPWGTTRDTVVYGALAWPLDRAPVGSAVDLGRERRQQAAARDDLVERIAGAWHRREEAARDADEVAAELGVEEADAELEALTGDAVEDAP